MRQFRQKSALVGFSLLAISLLGQAVSAETAVDLAHDAHLEMRHVYYIRVAGDLNGDGRQDVVVADCGFNESTGKVFALFGPFKRGVGNPSDLVVRGFVVRGGNQGDSACDAQAAGDVNGDGMDDLVVGAQGAFNTRGEKSGVAYVVFGKKTTERINLGSFGSVGEQRGYRIEGAFSHDQTGAVVAGAQDVNADGLSDVIIGAPFAGSAYVVFGQTTTNPIDLLTFESNTQGPLGYRIATHVPDRNGQFSVSGAGDVNGDDVPDSIVGVVGNVYGRGHAYVVFGKLDPALVLTTELATTGQGFVIRGPRPCARAGMSVSSTGDANKDGLADVAVGAPAELCNQRGNAYVVFGRSSTEAVELRTLENDGYKIRGTMSTPYGDSTAESIAPAGDVNGDGRGDLLVGSKGTSFKKRGGTGAAFVVYGKGGSGQIELSHMGRHGYKIGGIRQDDLTGFDVSGGLDLNRDSIPDQLISGIRWDGLSFMVWGRRR